MESKKHIIKYKTKFKTKNLKDTHQTKYTKHQYFKAQQTNKIHKTNTIKTHTNIKPNKIQFKYYKTILHTIQNIYIVKINTSINNIPIKIHRINAGHVKKNTYNSNVINNTNLNKPTKYTLKHQQGSAIAKTAKKQARNITTKYTK